MRLFVLACRMRHFALWVGHGRFGVMLVPTLTRPLFWLTKPSQSGGTLVLRFGLIFFVWRAR